MIPLAIPNLCGNEEAYLSDCIKTNFVSSVGPYVDKFEEQITVASGAKGAVATASGTAGLHAALEVLNVKNDELVVVSSYTFIASANAISHCKAQPWLFDISAESWTIDPDLLETVLSEETIQQGKDIFHYQTGQRIAAILVVYTLGMPADMDKISQIGNKYNLPIVVDGAAALGAKYKGRKIGEIDAHLTVFSFNGNKTITAGGGGGVISNDEQLLYDVRHITTTARVGEAYDHDRIGYNYRMTNIQAAVGSAQMEMLDRFVEKKRKISDYYNNNLRSIKSITCFPQPEWAESACWFSGVLLDNKAITVADCIEYMRSKGIVARPFWKPMHLQKPYKDCLKTQMTVTNAIWDKVLTLPCSTQLTFQEQDYVIKTLFEIFEKEA